MDHCAAIWTQYELAAFFNFISGMISRLGEMGDKVETEFGISSQTIFTQICRIFLDGLRSSIFFAEAVVPIQV